MTEHPPLGQWLYANLPEVYRERDAAQGYPLRALLGVLGEQGDVVQDEVGRLYDNQFVETCEEWLVPYVAALVGYRPVNDIGGVSQRALAGRWIALVRRKGTAAALEEVARAATGWPAKVVEFFQTLAHPQFMNHARPAVHGALDLRDVPRLEALGSAFESAHHTVDVGRIAGGEGRHNIRNIGLFLWRLGAQPWPRHRAFEVGPRRYAAHSLGLDTQAFNPPLTEAAVTALAAAVNLPVPLARRPLDAALADFYPRAFRLWLDGLEVPLGGLRVCDLSDDGAGWAHAPANVVAFDPVLGRIATPAADPAPDVVEVELSTGFPGNVGGGAYERLAGFATALAPVVGVSFGDDLQLALDGVQAGGAVEIADSEAYGGAFAIAVDADRRLELRAANGQRPTLALTADLAVSGGAESEIAIDGLLIGGGAMVVPAAAGNALRRLILRHCTLVPGIAAAADGTPAQPAAPSLVVEAANVIVEIERSVLGGVRCHPSTVIIVRDSALDATEPENVALAALDDVGPAGRVTLEETTVIGKLHARVFTLVSNAILHAALAPGDAWPIAVAAEDTQSGCARFSFVPPGSRTPRRFRCQPSLALGEAMRAAEAANPGLTALERAAIERRVLARLRPGFAARRWGRPGYLQLSGATPKAIRMGADDESEMGLWRHLRQPQREENLRIRLDEFLPSGLEAGWIYET